jgi:hypothetical protein
MASLSSNVEVVRRRADFRVLVAAPRKPLRADEVAILAHAFGLRSAELVRADDACRSVVFDAIHALPPKFCNATVGPADPD